MGRQKSSDPPSTTKYRHHISEHSRMYDRVNLEGITHKGMRLEIYFFLSLQIILELDKYIFLNLLTKFSVLKNL